MKERLLEDNLTDVKRRKDEEKEKSNSFNFYG